MLELIISILLSLGLKADSANSKIVVNQEVISIAQSNSAYNELGGDGALNEIVVTDDDDPNQ